MTSLRITEIFFSLQGEARTVGRPTVFIRLTGCPLRCQYCDTSYAFQGGSNMSIEDILEQVSQYNTQYITVTGGEPLAQHKGCLELMHRLCDANYKVSLETSGSITLEGIDARVSKVMDLKTPDSQEQHQNKLDNLNLLNAQDQIKFVICSENDYQWAKSMLEQHRLDELVDDVLFSPSAEELNPAELANWIVRDQLNVRFQMQLHKTLWGNNPGV